MALTAASLTVVLKMQDELTAGLKTAAAGLKGTASEMDSFSSQAGKAGQALAGFGTTVAVGGVLAFGAGLASAVKEAADFEKTMSGISAVSGATAEEMDTLRGKALQLGADTSFSATEAGKGIEELIKAGVSVADVMGGAAAASLNLAAAGEVTVEEAATIASNAMNAFSIAGSDMAHVADTIAGAANASAIDVHEFGFSLSAAGAVAATVGFNFDDLATAIAVMGQAGVKGSDAGTSLKTMMLNLQPTTNKQKDMFRDLGLETFNLQAGLDYLAKQGMMPASESIGDVISAMAKSIDLAPDMSKWTKDEAKAFDDLQRKTGMVGSAFFDTNGKVKSMAEVAGVLQTAIGDLTEEQKISTLNTIFGSDAIRAGAILAKAGAEGFNEMAASMSKVTAESVAAERLNNLEGSIEKMKGSLQTAAIVIGTAFLPALRQIVDTSTEIINDNMPQMEAAATAMAAAFVAALPSITAFFQMLLDNRETIMNVAIAIGALIVISTVTGWILSFISAIAALGSALATAGAVVGTVVAILGGPITLVIIAIIALIALLAAAWANDWGDIREITASFLSFMGTLPGKISAFFIDILNKANLALQGLSAAFTRSSTSISTVWTTLWNSLAAVVTSIWTTITTAIQTAMTAIGLIFTIALGLWYTLFVERWVLIFQQTVAIWTQISTWFMDVFWTPLTTFITAQLVALGLLLDTTWAAISLAWITAWTAISVWFMETFWNPLVLFVTTTLTTLETLILTAWTAIQTTTTTIWQAISDWFTNTFWNPLVQTTTTQTQAIQTDVQTKWQEIQSKTTEIWNAISTFLSDLWNAMSSTATQVIGELSSSVSSIFQDLVGQAEGWATDMLGNFFDGLKQQGEKILKWVGDFVKKISDKMSSAGEEDSPSKMMFEHGANFGEGFRLGLESKLSAIQKTAASMAGAVAGTSVDVPGGVRDWIAEAVHRGGFPESWIEPMSQLAMLESTGNPGARGFDPGDPNNPPLGLLQVKQSHFSGTGLNPLNPIDNAIASMNYIKNGRSFWLGDPWNVLKNWHALGGYASGGLVPGYAGQPQLAVVHGGERVLTAKQQRTMNGNGANGITQNVTFNGWTDEHAVRRFEAWQQKQRLLFGRA